MSRAEIGDMASDSDAMTSDAAEGMDVRYGLEMDYESIPHLCAEHGLWLPEHFTPISSQKTNRWSQPACPRRWVTLIAAVERGA